MRSTIEPRHYIHWIHCNRCYIPFIKKERKLFLLACEHVICGTCEIVMKQNVNGPKIYKCNICLKLTRAAEIGNAMPANLKVLFHPEPYLDGLNTSQIMKFQLWHRRWYMTRLERQEFHIADEKKVTIKCKELCKKLFMDIREMRSDRNYCVRRVLLIKQQRRSMDDNRYRRSATVPTNLNVSTASTSSRKPPLPYSRNGSGITCFNSNLWSTKSFSL